ncbi:MAG: mycothiol system anti-sigma-R factor [Candidatus Nanopelagicales bacterium]
MSCTERDWDCSHARAHLDAFIDNEIAAEQQRLVEAHLAGCAGCHDEFGLEEVVKRLVARSCLDRAPDTLRTRVVAELIAIRVQIYLP